MPSVTLRTAFMESTNLRQAAAQIDDHFDDMLVDGMPFEAVAQVEAQRSAAHQAMQRRVLDNARQFDRPAQVHFSSLDDPIRQTY